MAVVLAAAFLGGGAVDAYGLHRCPHHDGLPGQHDGTRPPEASGHSAAHDHAAPAEEDDGGEHGRCSCIGTCNATSVALPGPSDAPLRASPQWADRQPQPVAPARVIVHDDYLLPFGTAPPFAR